MVAVAAGVIHSGHQPIALKPLQRGVHLPKIERTRGTGNRLEIGAQLVSVRWSLAQQTEKPKIRLETRRSDA
jgi:hypothetical protein